MYRCGNEYTNLADRANSVACQALEHGAVVTVPAHKRAIAVTQSAKKPIKKVSTPEQQARDRDAKLVIESELKKTQSQLEELRKNYGQITAAQDSERKQAIKQQMARAEADIVSLKRELKR